MSGETCQEPSESVRSHDANGRLDPLDRVNEPPTVRTVNASGHLRRALLRAIESGEGSRAVHRLGSAATSVTFHIEGHGRVTLLLDRRPPMLTDDEPGEITIELDVDQARRFSAGELVLSNHLLQGTVIAWGPVRKYLAVDPIVRALLTRSA